MENGKASVIFKIFFSMRVVLWMLILGLVSCNNQTTTAHKKSNEKREQAVLSNPVKIEELRNKASLAKAYCRQHKMNTDIAILIDMKIPSGLKRFVVWDYKRDTIIMSALVTHGCGTKKWGNNQSSEMPVFSNITDSHCSSLGKYKIGARGYSTFGIHVNYLLYGLEKTNNNALARTVVLHSWDVIPDKETYPAGIPESWGCPAVSNDFMMQLDAVLRSKTKPVLLWIYA